MMRGRGKGDGRAEHCQEHGAWWWGCMQRTTHIFHTFCIPLPYLD